MRGAFVSPYQFALTFPQIMHVLSSANDKFSGELVPEYSDDSAKSRNKPTKGDLVDDTRAFIENEKEGIISTGVDSTTNLASMPEEVFEHGKSKSIDQEHPVGSENPSNLMEDTHTKDDCVLPLKDESSSDIRAILSVNTNNGLSQEYSIDTENSNLWCPSTTLGYAFLPINTYAEGILRDIENMHVFHDNSTILDGRPCPIKLFDAIEEIILKNPGWVIPKTCPSKAYVNPVLKRCLKKISSKLYDDPNYIILWQSNTKISHILQMCTLFRCHVPHLGPNKTIFDHLNSKFVGSLFPGSKSILYNRVPRFFDRDLNETNKIFLMLLIIQSNSSDIVLMLLTRQMLGLN